MLRWHHISNVLVFVMAIKQSYILIPAYSQLFSGS